MKSSFTSPKETDSVSLQNMSNYFEELHADVHVVNDKYTKLIGEYLVFADENASKSKTKHSNFVLLRGLDTITNVFSMILFYTKNIDLTYYQCQKSFYYFLEFISQITEDQHVYLQLSSRDATTYVYKKTIYEISNEIKKNTKQPSTTTQQKIELINKFIEINKMILYDMFDNKNNYCCEQLKEFLKLSNKLNMDKVSLEDLTICATFIELAMMSITKEKTFTIVLLYLKKVSKNFSLIKKSKERFFNQDFYIQMENDDEKFIAWLFL
jgi:hypothetical protein